MADKEDESILINGFDSMTAKMYATSRAPSRHMLRLVASQRGKESDPPMYKNAPLVNHG